MRLLLLATSAFALSACSAFDMFGANQGYHHGAHGASYGHQTAGHYGATHGAVIGAQSDRYSSAQSLAYPGQSVSHNGPVHIYPNQQVAAAPVQSGFGGIPALRGRSAAPRYYSNLGAVMYDVDDEAFGIIGRVGVQKGYFGAELEGSAGVINDSERVTIVGADDAIVNAKASAGVDWSTAAFATARMPVADRFEILGRVGYHLTELEAKAKVDGDRLFKESAHSDGFAYGAGLEYMVDPRRALRLDYTRYESDDFITSDAVSASFVSRF